jgi:hypothetical protein
MNDDNIIDLIISGIVLISIMIFAVTIIRGVKRSQTYTLQSTQRRLHERYEEIEEEQ